MDSAKAPTPRRGRPRKEARKQLTGYLPEEMFEAFNDRVKANGQTISAALERAIKVWLEKEDEKHE